MKKRIAIPTEGDRIAGHFGHCPEFTIVDADGNKIVGKKVLNNPGHKPGFLPIFLKEAGVNLVVAGGMGKRAQDLFINNGIEVITGAAGSVQDIVKAFLAGQLVTAENICDH
ncbi:MAG: NifB/NifX family molybdenum-iron cluster-binding protein [Halanaerobiales bacterium]|nr:NifB/NifX family molybdenum-iron cluster-binding protein [Halanaerobiales bacterium]